jgi:hypothetical protein
LDLLAYFLFDISHLITLPICRQRRTIVAYSNRNF